MASNPTESQAILRQHSIFYEQTRLHPEIPPLRRFTAEGFHLLYCTAVEILDQEKECRKALLESGALPRGVTKFSVTDWQPTMMKDAKVKKEFTRYQDVLRRYWKDLTLLHRVASLPDPPRIATEMIRDSDWLFQNGLFELTGEDEGRYKESPADPDLCAIKPYPNRDIITNVAIEFSKILAKRVWNRIFPHRKSNNINILSIDAVLNYVMGVIIAVVLTAFLYCVSLGPSIESRIAILGGCAVIFNLSVQITAGPGRSELFLISASFFAIGGVIVTVTNNNHNSA